MQSGFVWINEVSKHFLGAPFGGYKQSGIGREECFEEMLAYTQEKNIHVKLKPAKVVDSSFPRRGKGGERKRAGPGKFGELESQATTRVHHSPCGSRLAASRRPE